MSDNDSGPSSSWPTIGDVSAEGRGPRPWVLVRKRLATRVRSSDDEPRVTVWTVFQDPTFDLMKQMKAAQVSPKREGEVEQVGTFTPDMDMELSVPDYRRLWTGLRDRISTS